MTHKINLKVWLFSFFLLIGSPLSAQRLHTVQVGETLYGISKKYGLTVDELLTVNQGLTVDNLKAGGVLQIPAATEQANTGSPMEKQTEHVNVALILPFSAQGLEGGRSIEFYRGFLMAAEQLAQRGTLINLHTFDESVGVRLTSVLQQIADNGVQVMVGPVYPEHFAEMASFARANRVRMVIPFYSKAEQVHTNPFVYLVNTPEKYEFEYIADLFLRTFKGMNVAFMRVGDGNKSTFIQYLRKRLMARGHALTEFSYEASLEQMKTACNINNRTVIIPDASDESALAKTLAKIEGFKKYYPQYDLQLFGYPEWNECMDKYKVRLHAADTYIFTGNFFNPYDGLTRTFITNYRSKYGETLQAVFPRMGLLGYDLAMHLVMGIECYGVDFCTQRSGASMLQSDFRFERTEEEGGLVNSSLFFIHFCPDGRMEKLAATKK